MEYTKLNLVNGEVIRQEHLAHFEDAIAKLADETSSSPIQYIESTDTSNLVNIRDLESGTYVFYGKFKPFSTSTASLTFSSKLLVNVVKRTADSQVMVFYPVNNCVQYLKVTDDSYERKNIYLNDLQTEADVIDTVTSAIDAKQRILLWDNMVFHDTNQCADGANVTVTNMDGEYLGVEVIFFCNRGGAVVSSGFIPYNTTNGAFALGVTTKGEFVTRRFKQSGNVFTFDGAKIGTTMTNTMLLPYRIYGFK